MLDHEDTLRGLNEALMIKNQSGFSYDPSVQTKDIAIEGSNRDNKLL